jgi:hypothetical protein
VPGPVWHEDLKLVSGKAAVQHVCSLIQLNSSRTSTRAIVPLQRLLFDLYNACVWKTLAQLQRQQNVKLLKEVVHERILYMLRLQAREREAYNNS